MKKIISIAVCCWLIFIYQAKSQQANKGANFNLSKPINSSATYIGTNSVNLLPGFQFSAIKSGGGIFTAQSRQQISGTPDIEIVKTSINSNALIDDEFSVIVYSNNTTNNYNIDFDITLPQVLNLAASCPTGGQYYYISSANITSQPSHGTATVGTNNKIHYSNSSYQFNNPIETLFVYKLRYNCDFLNSGISFFNASNQAIVFSLENLLTNNSNSSVNFYFANTNSTCAMKNSYCFAYPLDYPLIAQYTNSYGINGNFNIHPEEKYYRKIAYKNQGTATFNGKLIFHDNISYVSVSNYALPLKIISTKVYKCSALTNDMCNNYLSPIENILPSTNRTIFNANRINTIFGNTSINSPITAAGVLSAYNVDLSIDFDSTSAGTSYSKYNVNPNEFIVVEEELETAATPTSYAYSSTGQIANSKFGCSNDLNSSVHILWGGQSVTPSAGTGYQDADFCSTASGLNAGNLCSATKAVITNPGLQTFQIKRDGYVADLSGLRLLPADNAPATPSGGGNVGNVFWDNSCFFEQPTTGGGTPQKQKWIFAFTNNSLVNAYNVHLKLNNPNLPFSFLAGQADRFSYTFIDRSTLHLNDSALTDIDVNYDKTKFDFAKVSTAYPFPILVPHNSANTNPLKNELLAGSFLNFPVSGGSSAPDAITSSNPCLTNALQNYEVVFDVLQPNQLILISFETVRCCATDGFLFNRSVDYNDWNLSMNAEDECGANIPYSNYSAYKSVTSNPNACNCINVGSLYNNPIAFDDKQDVSSNVSDLSTINYHNPLYYFSYKSGISPSPLNGGFYNTNYANNVVPSLIQNQSSLFVDNATTTNIAIDGGKPESDIQLIQSFTQTVGAMNVYAGWNNHSFLTKADFEIQNFQWGTFSNLANGRPWYNYEWYTTYPYTISGKNQTDNSSNTSIDWGSILFEIQSDFGLYVDNGTPNDFPEPNGNGNVNWAADIPDLEYTGSLWTFTNKKITGQNFSTTYSSANNDFATVKFPLYDIAQLIASSNTTKYPTPNYVTGEEIKEFIERSKFNFKLSAVCTNIPTPVCNLKFYFVPPVCTTQCKIPLYLTSFPISVFCPGCKYPGGAITTDYLSRDLSDPNSIGYVDDNNDGIADNNSQVNTNFDDKVSLVGDKLIAVVNGKMQEGTVSYSNIETHFNTTPNNILNGTRFFKYLYLDQDIPHSSDDKSKGDVSMQIITGSTVEFRMSTSGYKANSSWLSDSSKYNKFIRFLRSKETLGTIPSSSNFKGIENYNTAAECFVFKLDYSSSAINFSSTVDVLRAAYKSNKFEGYMYCVNPALAKFQFGNFGYTGTYFDWGFEVDDSYQFKAALQACYDPSGNFPITSPSEGEIATKLVDRMYFTPVQAENKINTSTPPSAYDAICDGFDPGAGSNPPQKATDVATSINDLNPQGTGANYYYMCQGGIEKGHTIYLTGTSMSSYWSDQVNGSDCYKSVETNITRKIGFFSNVFKNEYRIPRNLPTSLTIQFPLGYNYLSTIAATSLYDYKQPFNTYEYPVIGTSNYTVTNQLYPNAISPSYLKVDITGIQYPPATTNYFPLVHHVNGTGPAPTDNLIASNSHPNSYGTPFYYNAPWGNYTTTCGTQLNGTTYPYPNPNCSEPNTNNGFIIGDENAHFYFKSFFSKATQVPNGALQTYTYNNSDVSAVFPLDNCGSSIDVPNIDNGSTGTITNPSIFDPNDYRHVKVENTYNSSYHSYKIQTKNNIIDFKIINESYNSVKSASNGEDIDVYLFLNTTNFPEIDLNSTNLYYQNRDNNSGYFGNASKINFTTGGSNIPGVLFRLTIEHNGIPPSNLFNNWVTNSFAALKFSFNVKSCYNSSDTTGIEIPFKIWNAPGPNCDNSIPVTFDVTDNNCIYGANCNNCGTATTFGNCNSNSSLFVKMGTASMDGNAISAPNTFVACSDFSTPFTYNIGLKSPSNGLQAGTANDLHCHFQIDKNIDNPKITIFTAAAGDFDIIPTFSSGLVSLSVTQVTTGSRGSATSYIIPSTVPYTSIYTPTNNDYLFDIPLPGSIFNLSPTDTFLGVGNPIGVSISGKPNCLYHLTGNPPIIQANALLYCGDPIPATIPLTFQTQLAQTGSNCSLTMNPKSTPSCPSSSNGKIQIDVCGGSGNYTVSGALSNPPHTPIPSSNITNTGTTFLINNLAAGTYTITVTDNTTFTSVSTGTSNNPPNIAITQQNSPLCSPCSTACQGTNLAAQGIVADKWVLCNSTFGGAGTYTISNFITQLNNGSNIFNGFDPSNGLPVQLVINDDLIIDQDFTFQNCDYIEMAPHAIIDVQPSITLNIDQCTIYAACSLFWEGIRMSNSSTPRTPITLSNSSLNMQNTEFRDAYDGVYAPLGAANITLKNNKFFNNRWAVHLIERRWNSKIVFNAIEGNEFAGVFNGSRTVVNDFYTTCGTAGMVCRNMVLDPNFYTIGNPSSTAVPNTFHDLNMGIISHGSNLNIYNNQFYNIVMKPAGMTMTPTSYPNQNGISIWGRQYAMHFNGGSNNIGGTQSIVDATYGNTSYHYGNEINCSDAGIWMEDYVGNQNARTNNIFNNEITGSDGCSGNGGGVTYPIYFNNFNDNELTVKLNSIGGGNGCITVNNQKKLLTSTPINNLNIYLNDLGPNLSSTHSHNIDDAININNIDNTNISISNFMSPLSSGGTAIGQSIFAMNGLQLQGITQTGSFTPTLNINNVDVEMYAFARSYYSPYNENCGIRLNNCMIPTNVSHNTVHAIWYNNANPSNGNILSIGTYNYTWLKGYHVEATPGFTMHCNEAHRMGKGFQFNGNASGTTNDFSGNELDLNYEQFMLNSVGIIGPQGTATGNLNWNKFVYNNPNPSYPLATQPHHDTYATNGSNGNQSAIYYPTSTTQPYKPGWINATANPPMNDYDQSPGSSPMTPSQNLSPTNADDCSANASDAFVHPNVNNDEINNILEGIDVNHSGFSMPTEATWNGQRSWFEFLYRIYQTRNTTPNTNGMSSQQAAEQIAIHQRQLNYYNAVIQNSTVSNWYNAMLNGNMGKFQQVQELINQGLWSNAQSLNNSINTTLLPEINQKNYNNIIIQRYTRMLSMPH